MRKIAKSRTIQVVMALAVFSVGLFIPFNRTEAQFPSLPAAASCASRRSFSQRRQVSAITGGTAVAVRPDTTVVMVLFPDPNLAAAVGNTSKNGTDGCIDNDLGGTSRNTWFAFTGRRSGCTLTVSELIFTPISGTECSSREIVIHDTSVCDTTTVCDNPGCTTQTTTNGANQCAAARSQGWPSVSRSISSGETNIIEYGFAGPNGGDCNAWVTLQFTVTCPLPPPL